MADDVKPMTIEEIDQVDRVLSMMDAGTLDEAISPLAWAGVRRLLATARAGLADTSEPEVGRGLEGTGKNVPHEVLPSAEDLLRDFIFHTEMNHPLPWSIVSDWTEEVTASDGTVVFKARSREIAERIIAIAEELDRELTEFVKDQQREADAELVRRPDEQPRR